MRSEYTIRNLICNAKLFENVMNKKHMIYAHINKINGKIYIGQTCKKKSKYRWGPNGICYRKQSKFYNAILKYGWNNFEHIILEDNISSNDINERERFYIQKFNSIKCGYNSQEGGLNHMPITQKRVVYQFDLNGNFIKKWKSISEAGETLNIALGSIVKVCKNQLLSCGGYMWSYKKDISSKRVAKTNAKKICQYDLNGNLIKTFDSQKQASIELTGNESSKSKICSCCKKSIKTALGYVWRYSNDTFSYRKDIYYCRRVCQLDASNNLIKTWDSLADIYRELGIRQGNIYTCCQGKRRTAGGYVWKYEEDYLCSHQKI